MRYLQIIFIALTLSSCTEAVVAGGVAAVGTSVAQERSVGNAIDDAAIDTQIKSLFLQANVDYLFAKVSTKVHEGRVLLTGVVPTGDLRAEATALAWKPRGVKEVVNEIQVRESGDFLDYSSDVWISTQVRSKLLLTKGVRSVNYYVETVNNVVYLFGVAQNPEELKLATDVVRHINGVERVVAHMRYKDTGMNTTQETLDNASGNKPLSLTGDGQ